MSKIFKFLEKYEKITNPIQCVIYIFIASAIIATIIGLIFGIKSCQTKDTIETVEAKYFMNEKVIVHNNYDVMIYYARTVGSITYLKNKNDKESTSIIGNFIEVNLDITKKSDSAEKNHKLDANDFKLKNHSGVYLPLNDIMGLFNIDAIDVNINTDENGCIISSADFNSKNAVKDYTWVGVELKNGETINLTLYFDLKEGYKVEDDLMLLEIDFYLGGNGIKKGEDIVLLNCRR